MLAIGAPGMRPYRPPADPSKYLLPLRNRWYGKWWGQRLTRFWTMGFCPSMDLALYHTVIILELLKTGRVSGSTIARFLRGFVSFCLYVAYFSRSDDADDEVQPSQMAGNENHRNWFPRAPLERTGFWAIRAKFTASLLVFVGGGWPMKMRFRNQTNKWTRPEIRWSCSPRNPHDKKFGSGEPLEQSREWRQTCSLPR